MKFTQTLVVVIVVMLLAKQLAYAASVPRVVPVQVELIGSDAAYEHGAHCIDGRTF